MLLGCCWSVFSRGVVGVYSVGVSLECVQLGSHWGVGVSLFSYGVVGVCLFGVSLDDL